MSWRRPVPTGPTGTLSSSTRLWMACFRRASTSRCRPTPRPRTGDDGERESRRRCGRPIGAWAFAAARRTWRESGTWPHWCRSRCRRPRRPHRSPQSHLHLWQKLGAAVLHAIFSFRGEAHYELVWTAAAHDLGENVFSWREFEGDRASALELLRGDRDGAIISHGSENTWTR